MNAGADSVPTCLHCETPLDEARISLADTAGIERVAAALSKDTGIGPSKDKLYVCSTACLQAATQIVSSGLSDYYAHRSPFTANTKQPTQRHDWSAYERPQVMREFVRELPDDSRVADLLIQGVHCAACTWLIENALHQVDGVVSIAVNPLTTRAELQWSPSRINLASLLEKIAGLGFTPIPFTERATQAAAEDERRAAMRRLLVAGLGMMQVTSYAIAMYAGAFQGMDPQIESFLRLISLLVATPIVIYSGAPFFIGALRSLRSRRPGMDVPIALAIGGAWAASVWNTFVGSGEVYFDSATMFVFFLSGTRYLEAAGRYRALDLTNSLAQQLPCTALRLTFSTTANSARQEEVGVMELESGDTVLVPTGVAFPADGTLLSNVANVDESMLTGEALTVDRHQGDAVVAGTVNMGAAVRINVTKTGPNTVLAQIGRLVTQAGRDRPQVVELTDRIGSVFVVAVLAIATLTGLIWWLIDSERAFSIVLSVLVVTCPCALALATPAAFTVATSRLAREGFLVRRAGALQRLADVSHAVFDKTGTLTDNFLRLADVHCATGHTDEEVLQLAAALEADSAHPIARAFRRSDQSLRATSIVETPGGGLSGCINGHEYRIGTRNFVSGLSNGDAGEFTAAAATDLRTLYLGSTAGLLARFDIAETLRAGSAAGVRELEGIGIGATIASGDQSGPVAALAKQVGISDWRAALLPGEKLELVRELQSGGATVVAVGDGINDSPVLAGADVSIAMGSGTSSAQHSADCVWLGHQLTRFEQPFVVARKTMRIVHQNLAWALGYNLLAIPLAATGSIAPWMAALGMSLSSLLVMLNALRLSSNGSSAADNPQATAPGTLPAAAPVQTACCEKQSGAPA